MEVLMKRINILLSVATMFMAGYCAHKIVAPILEWILSYASKSPTTPGYFVTDLVSYTQLYLTLYLAFAPFNGNWYWVFSYYYFLFIFKLFIK